MTPYYQHEIKVDGHTYRPIYEHRLSIADGYDSIVIEWEHVFVKKYDEEKGYWLESYDGKAVCTFIPWTSVIYYEITEVDIELKEEEPIEDESGEDSWLKNLK